jgi:hypothetical protein
MFDSGTRFGRLTVVRDRGCTAVDCQCRCGRKTTVSRHRLRVGETRSCGCLRSEMLREKWKKVSKATAIPLGSVFGRLTVRKTHRQWVLCSCTCGRETWVWKYDLRNGKTSSCGCLAREVSAENLRRTATIHGGWGTKEWNSWHSMIERCHNPDAMGYENYGGRGVRVYRRWLGRMGFPHFLTDVGRAPSPIHTLDRIRTNGNYGPGNVRWATPKEQSRNKRNNRIIVAFGRRQCLAAWAEETGLSATTISLRLLKGQSAKQALRRRPGE